MLSNALSSPPPGHQRFRRPMAQLDHELDQALQELRGILDCDRFIARLVGHFRDNCESAVEALERGLRTADRSVLTVQAHTLKSSAATMGAGSSPGDSPGGKRSRWNGWGPAALQSGGSR